VKSRHGDAHKRKVSGARSLIDNGWSVREEQKLQASRRNVKKEVLQDNRFTNIEQENVRLLMRMQEIDRRQVERRPGLGGGGGGAGKAAAQIVLGMPKPDAPTKSVARCSSLPAMGRGSNGDARMRELRRIDKENLRMLKRLQGAKSTVSKSRLEVEHQAQQRVMRMRQESGPKVRGGNLNLPFSLPPTLPVDTESDRLEELHAKLQRRVLELDMMDAPPEDGAVTLSARSAGSALAVPADEASLRCKTTSETREYVGGQLPEHSRALVEKLMEDYEQETLCFGRDLQQQAHAVEIKREDETSTALDDKDAVAKMLAAVEALDAQDGDPLGCAMNYQYLSYDNVVQRSRAALRAADASLNGS
jgi:hypothetical protein